MDDLANIIFGGAQGHQMQIPVCQCNYHLAQANALQAQAYFPPAPPPRKLGPYQIAYCDLKGWNVSPREIAA